MTSRLSRREGTCTEIQPLLDFSFVINLKGMIFLSCASGVGGYR